MIITQDYLKEMFFYENGSLYRKHKVNKLRPDLDGKKAGYLHPNGYVYIEIKSKPQLVHRMIFLMLKGYLPKYIDHINCNKSDNRIENLREASHSDNCKNIKKLSSNTSGTKCVHFDKKSKKWIVRLTINGKRIRFGNFHDFELASLVAAEAITKHYGKFARIK